MPRLQPALIASILLTVLGGCHWQPLPGGLGAPPYYSGTVQQTATLRNPPLTLELQQAEYHAGTGRTSGAPLSQEPFVRLYLRLTNDGPQTVVLFDRPPPTATAAPPVDFGRLPYHLVDEQGRVYRLKGTGWTRHEGEPNESVGTVPPGQTAEFSLTFAPIPRAATSVTLVMPEVPTEAGGSYPLGRLPIPLPDS